MGPGPSSISEGTHPPIYALVALTLLPLGSRTCGLEEFLTPRVTPSYIVPFEMPQEFRIPLR